MKQYSVSLSVVYIKERLELGPYSFQDYDTAQNWIKRFSKRLEDTQARWMYGTKKKGDLECCLITNKNEGGEYPPSTQNLVKIIEDWYLTWSLAYNIEKIKPNAAQ